MQIAECKLLIAAGAVALAGATLLAQARPQPGTTLPGAAAAWDDATARSDPRADVSRESKPGAWFATHEQIARYVKNATR